MSTIAADSTSTEEAKTLFQRQLQPDGSVTPQVHLKSVLFLCVANSARSQMAEGLARSILPPTQWTFQSAGSHPSYVNPFAIEVMKELDIEFSRHTSKSVDTINPTTVQLIITLCDEEVCPRYPHRVQRLHWSTPDPASNDPSIKENRPLLLERFRRARDSIASRIRSELLEFEAE